MRSDYVKRVAAQLARLLRQILIIIWNTNIQANRPIYQYIANSALSITNDAVKEELQNLWLFYFYDIHKSQKMFFVEFMVLTCVLYQSNIQELGTLLGNGAGDFSSSLMWARNKD